MRLNCIFARSINGKMFGNDGNLPWRCEPFKSDPEISEFSKKDMAHFRQVTSGNIVIMGYNTYLTFAKPLEGRWNIVIDRNFKFSGQIFELNEELKKEWIFFDSLESCLGFLEKAESDFFNSDKRFPEVWLIGGKKIIDYCKKNSLINGVIDETVYPWKM